MTTAEANKTTETTEDTMRRYPLLTAHMVCESLGYFTPRAAANAIQAHKKGHSHACEWYLSMARPGHSLKDIGADTIRRAFKRRRFHRGYMADFPSALHMVQSELRGYIPMVHISITNPDPESPLPYFRGKGQLEEALRATGVTYAILRPTVLYSAEDILLNNIAWTLRRFPVVLLPGSGDYGIQPVFVEDLARLAVDAAQGEDNVEIDAVGPEVFTYAGMVRLLRDRIGTHCLVLPSPPALTYAAGRVLGLFLGDIVLTRDEIKGLSAGLLVSKSEAEPPGRTRLSEWLDQHGEDLGRSYANEVKRHYR